MAWLEKQWASFVPDQPFVWQFLDEHVEALYRTDKQVRDVVGIVAILAILIACLGLYGLASITTEQRRREIAVRKVLGASVSGLVLLLCTSFARLVLAAFVISLPLTWVSMSAWLENFAYRITLDWSVFLGVGLVGLAIAVLAVSYHSIRSALANPAEALSTE